MAAALSRREALRSIAAGSAVGALGAGVVMVAAPVETSTVTACPMLDLVTRIEALRVERDALPDDEHDAFHEKLIRSPEWVFAHETPVVLSVAGAAAAIRLALSYDAIEAEDERPIRRALAFLDGRA